jgi:hypothetical protein
MVDFETAGENVCTVANDALVIWRRNLNVSEVQAMVNQRHQKACDDASPEKCAEHAAHTGVECHGLAERLGGSKSHADCDRSRDKDGAGAVLDYVLMVVHVVARGEKADVRIVKVVVRHVEAPHLRSNQHGARGVEICAETPCGDAVIDYAVVEQEVTAGAQSRVWKQDPCLTWVESQTQRPMAYFAWVLE